MNETAIKEHQETKSEGDLVHQQKAEHYMRLLELWAAELTLATNEGRDQPNNQERLTKCATSINGGLVLLRMHLELKNLEDIVPIKTTEATSEAVHSDSEQGDIIPVETKAAEATAEAEEEEPKEELPEWTNGEEGHPSVSEKES